MKKLYKILFLIFICFTQVNTKNKQETKFERILRECGKTLECKQRYFDENCVFKCISEICYREIYMEYLLEYGELNIELRNRFEKCYNSLNK